MTINGLKKILSAEQAALYRAALFKDKNEFECDTKFWFELYDILDTVNDIQCISCGIDQYIYQQT